MIDLIEPEWDAPAPVRAVSTTRCGGISQGPYAGLNLAQHVGDIDQHVQQNREQLIDALRLAHSPCWINQTHSARVVILEQDKCREADAAITCQPGLAAVVMTADCLPILLSNRAGTEVAAVHAGWRGLQAGIIDSALSKMQTEARDLMAWIGPGISRQHFEVGDEVYTAYVESIADCESWFTPHGKGHWLCDLGGIADDELTRLGVPVVIRYPGCTYAEDDRFFSYRRDGVTGRMASLIWINSESCEAPANA